MAYISAMKLPDNNTYDLKDSRVAVPVPADAVFTDHIFSGLAEDVDYDNTTSGLTATTVQEALDEIGAGGGSTGCVELTQAEYDALTEEEKLDDVIYLITDSPDNYLDEVFGDFASVEYTNTVSKAYSIGDYLIYDNKFYKVTSDIAQGGTITPGTNVAQTTVGDELDGLRNDVGSPSSASSVTGSDAFSKIATLYSNINAYHPQAGYDAMTDVTTTENDKYVSFPQAFQYAPHVVIQFYASSYNRRIHVKSISQYGFTWTGALNSGSGSGAIEIQWIAV